MNDLDKVYAESVAKDYMPKETNKVRQLKKLDERAKLPAFISMSSAERRSIQSPWGSFSRGGRSA